MVTYLVRKMKCTQIGSDKPHIIQFYGLLRRTRNIRSRLNLYYNILNLVRFAVLYYSSIASRVENFRSNTFTIHGGKSDAGASFKSPQKCVYVLIGFFFFF